ncbi:MAG: hypothetical protein M1818_005722 [Claussenomyces sp. TS43310]|nr:MAG: hypothetical protein M1818_005722 [Claussenomyces sp. TS43310]
MDSQAVQSTALLTEHFRYAPVSLIDDIINSINELSYRAVDSVEQGLLGAPLSTLGFSDREPGDSAAVSAEDRAKHEIENGAHQLETLLEASIDKYFDMMEVVALRSILSIPEDLKDWIQLKHYEGLNFVLSPDTPTTESITLQRRKFQENQRLRRLLLAEHSRNTALIAHLRSLHAEAAKQPPVKAEQLENSNVPAQPAFAFLSETGGLSSGSASAPLHTTTAFTLSQLPALKALLAELRGQMKTLGEKDKKDPNIIEVEDRMSWRKERREYIETQTRRHLENVAGLELGKNGELTDGAWQGEGRKLGKGEVEDLERVVAMMGGKSDTLPVDNDMDESK